MADLDNFDYTSILDMNNDEAIETLRQIRLSRRVPEKTTKTITKKKNTPNVSANMAAEILNILGASDD